VGHLRAVLVEAVRVDGRPRQRHIAYLGGIAGNRIADAEACWQFWKAVTERLNRLGNRISEEEQGKIIAVITAKVGEPPTQQQLDDALRERDRRLKEWGMKITAAFAGLDKCKFCGKKLADVEVLVTGKAAAICNECLDCASECVCVWRESNGHDDDFGNDFWLRSGEAVRRGRPGEIANRTGPVEAIPTPGREGRGDRWDWS
jgi:hypothetical protein